jgi:hypothetical protein
LPLSVTPLSAPCRGCGRRLRPTAWLSATTASVSAKRAQVEDPGAGGRRAAVADRHAADPRVGAAGDLEQRGTPRPASRIERSAPAPGDRHGVGQVELAQCEASTSPRGGVIVSGPAASLAALTASRSEQSASQAPSAPSAAFVTSNVAARAGGGGHEEAGREAGDECLAPSGERPPARLSRPTDRGKGQLGRPQPHPCARPAPCAVAKGLRSRAPGVPRASVRSARSRSGPTATTPSISRNAAPAPRRAGRRLRVARDSGHASRQPGRPGAAGCRPRRRRAGTRIRRSVRGASRLRSPGGRVRAGAAAAVIAVPGGGARGRAPRCSAGGPRWGRPRGGPSSPSHIVAPRRRPTSLPSARGLGTADLEEPPRLCVVALGDRQPRQRLQRPASALRCAGVPQERVGGLEVRPCRPEPPLLAVDLAERDLAHSPGATGWSSARPISRARRSVRAPSPKAPWRSAISAQRDSARVRSIDGGARRWRPEPPPASARSLPKLPRMAQKGCRCHASSKRLLGAPVERPQASAWRKLSWSGASRATQAPDQARAAPRPPAPAAA